MAGGDLLFIFAFIILPTAVLVSCIWALVMLRNGALLPDRRVAARDGSKAVAGGEEDALDRANLAEETGEHVVVDLASPSPVGSSPVAPARVANGSLATKPDPCDEAGRVSTVMLPPTTTDDPPVVEQTQELAVLPPNDGDIVGDQLDDVTVPDEPKATVDDADVEPSGDSAKSDANGANLLIVPLDELSRSVAGSSSSVEAGATGAAGPTEQDAAEPDPDALDAEPATATSPRKPARRAMQLRPADGGATHSRPRAGQRRAARRTDGE